MVNASNSLKASLLDENAISKILRQRNKKRTIPLCSLIFLLALITGTLYLFLLHDQNSQPNDNFNPAVQEFCSVSNHPISCLRYLNPIISNKVKAYPAQIFTLSLSLSIEKLHSITLFTGFKNCSNSLGDAMSQLIRVERRVTQVLLDVNMQVNEDFIRRETLKAMINAGDNLTSCIDVLKEMNDSPVEARGKLHGIMMHVENCINFLMRYNEI